QDRSPRVIESRPGAGSYGPISPQLVYLAPMRSGSIAGSFARQAVPTAALFDAQQLALDGQGPHLHPTKVSVQRDDERESRSSADEVERSAPRLAAGKQTLTMRLPPMAEAVQMKGEAGLDDAHAHGVAAQGVSGAAGPLPHRATIERLFGRHDVRDV